MSPLFRTCALAASLSGLTGIALPAQAFTIPFIPLNNNTGETNDAGEDVPGSLVLNNFSSELVVDCEAGGANCTFIVDVDTVFNGSDFDHTINAFDIDGDMAGLTLVNGGGDTMGVADFSISFTGPVIDFTVVSSTETFPGSNMFQEQVTFKIGNTTPATGNLTIPNPPGDGVDGLGVGDNVQITQDSDLEVALTWIVTLCNPGQVLNTSGQCVAGTSGPNAGVTAPVSGQADFSVCYDIIPAQGQAPSVPCQIAAQTGTFSATVPEPATAALLGIGLGLIGLSRRRRARH